MVRYVDAVNAKPDARYGDLRVMVETGVINENDDVVGFMISFSRKNEHGTMWVRLGVPDGSEVKR